MDLDVHMVAVFEDHRVAGALGWVVVAPAVAGLAAGGPDPVVEDHGLDGEPVGLADEVLRDGPAPRLVRRRDRTDEHVDRTAVVVRRTLHVPGRHAPGSEATERLVRESRDE